MAVLTGRWPFAWGEQMIGKADWFTSTAWGRANTSACWEIAIGLFPEYRGKSLGTQAQRQLVDYLFTHYPRHRIQATTAAENTAEQRCLEKLGFTREGVIRQAQWRDGGWHDQIIYSVLRDEWAGWILKRQGPRPKGTVRNRKTVPDRAFKFLDA